MDQRLFNIEEFDIKLDTEVFGRHFVYVDELESTNSFLMNTKDYRHNGTVIMAEFQTGGRGRRERVWMSQKGLNLTFSILLNEYLDELNPNTIVFGAAVAVAQAVENLFQLKVETKWPNDLLIDGKKLCGILIETSSKGSKLEKMVVGFGINVNQANFSGKYIYPPTSVRNEFKSTVSRERLLSEVLNNLEKYFVNCAEKPAQVMNDWKARCKMLGEKIQVEDSGVTTYGKFEDLDNEGYLILRTAEGTRKIMVGDVSIR